MSDYRLRESVFHPSHQNDTKLLPLQQNYFQYDLTAHISSMGYEGAQLVQALRYKPEGRGFDSADLSGRAV